MFKFIKELIDAAREGVAEAREELADEEAQRVKGEAQQVVADEARIAHASSDEQFVVALAAPYREIFSPALKAARETGRRPAHLYCVEIPDAEIPTWAGLIERDFAVAGPQDAQALLETLTEAFDQEGFRATDNAAWIARTCHAVTAAVAVGHLDKAEALERIAPVVEQARGAFQGWPDYGKAFLTSEQSLPGSNILGRKFLAAAVDRLLTSDASPWNGVPWPPARDGQR